MTLSGRMRTKSSLLFIATGLIAALFALSGCGTSTDSGSSARRPGEMPVAEMAPSDAVTGDFMSGDMATGVNQTSKQVIRTGSVSLISNNASDLVQQITEIVETYGGSVTSQDLRSIDNQQYANLTVTVPDSDLEKFVAEIQSLGETRGVSISAVDVTLTVTDLDARISALNSTIDKLNQLRDQATNVTDLVAVESELAARTAERDSLAAQRDLLQNQVAESTVYIDISPDPETSTTSPDFIEGIKSGWFALINLLAGAITFIGFLVPFVLALLVLIGIVILIRRVRRTKRTRHQD